MDEQVKEIIRKLTEEVKDLEWKAMFWQTLDEIHYKRAFKAEQELQELYLRVWELERKRK